jgi:trk system potassium uptake protein TrkA
MKILILGAGQVGRTVARHFSREEANDVTVVDNDEDVLRDLQDRLDVHTVAGNAAFPSVLQAAGAGEADLLVALTNSDEVNMMACEVAFRLFRTPTKIARIRSAEYTSRPELFSETAIPVDVFISPEQLVTEYLERLIHHPGAFQLLEFAGGKVRLVGARSEPGGLLVGHSLRELPELLGQIQTRVVAIYRAGRLVPPQGDSVIEAGDEVFFLAVSEDVHSVIGALRREDSRVRRVLIAGGGNIGQRLARSLERGAQVKLIEHDSRRAQLLSEQLENTIVLSGDAADEELLIEENIDSADVFAAITNSEETNILSAMLAKRLGARRVMALVNASSYADLIESGSIDVAVTPQTITIGTLLAHVRRGEVVRVHALRRGAAEAIEAVARGEERSSRVVGRTVQDIDLPEGASIGAIVRGEQVLMAHHDTRIRANDHLILFLADRRHIDAVERLLMRAAP